MLTEIDKQEIEKLKTLSLKDRAKIHLAIAKLMVIVNTKGINQQLTIEETTDILNSTGHFEIAKACYIAELLDETWY